MKERSFPCKIRINNSDSNNEVRKKALKLGSTSITSKTVGPNQVEITAEFKKSADKKKYEAWVNSKYRDCVCCECE